VGFLDQPPFVNAAAAVITRLAPAALHESLMALERQLGKAPPSVRFGPRRIDLDLLAYSDLVLAEPALTVPHPRLHERAFVLYPLNDIAPALWLPGRGRVATLARAVDGSGVSLAAGEIE
jgi:2-amino-4-hydroxy-6-hydroxymethyldihydropteridine diphosphokinase